MNNYIESSVCRGVSRLLLAPVAVMATMLLVTSVANASSIGDFVVPGSKAATVENCVEPTEYMRRFHFEVIRHQRDTTVYGGIRSTKHSMAGCVDCHVGYDAEKQPVAINGDGQFCQSCHEYAAVKLNCFDCHATIPEGEGWNHEAAAAHGHAHELGSPGGGVSPRMAQTISGTAGDVQSRVMSEGSDR
jgi:hypothetical protein